MRNSVNSRTGKKSVARADVDRADGAAVVGGDCAKDDRRVPKSVLDKVVGALKKPAVSMPGVDPIDGDTLGNAPLRGLPIGGMVLLLLVIVGPAKRIEKQGFPQASAAPRRGSTATARRHVRAVSECGADAGPGQGRGRVT